MTNLSPAAQAVLDAFNSVPYYPDENDEGMLAAALRAAADRVYHHWDGAECVDYLCSIATELETND